MAFTANDTIPRYPRCPQCLKFHAPAVCEMYERNLDIDPTWVLIDQLRERDAWFAEMFEAIRVDQQRRWWKFWR